MSNLARTVSDVFPGRKVLIVGDLVADQFLQGTIARVSRSASRDESRPVLTGILVRFEAGKLVMVATDSYRLSVKETAVETYPRGGC